MPGMCLRIQPGERVTVLDGAGQEFLCEVRDFDHGNVRLEVIERRFHRAPQVRSRCFKLCRKGRSLRRSSKRQPS